MIRIPYKAPVEAWNGSISFFKMFETSDGAVLAATACDGLVCFCAALAYMEFPSLSTSSFWATGSATTCIISYHDHHFGVYGLGNVPTARYGCLVQGFVVGGTESAELLPRTSHRHPLATLQASEVRIHYEENVHGVLAADTALYGLHICLGIVAP